MVAAGKVMLLLMILSFKPDHQPAAHSQTRKRGKRTQLLEILEALKLAASTTSMTSMTFCYDQICYTKLKLFLYLSISNKYSKILDTLLRPYFFKILFPLIFVMQPVLDYFVKGLKDIFFLNIFSCQLFFIGELLLLFCSVYVFFLVSFFSI